MLWGFLAGFWFAGTLSDCWCCVFLKRYLYFKFVLSRGVCCGVSAIGHLISSMVMKSV